MKQASEEVLGGTNARKIVEKRKREVYEVQDYILAKIDDIHLLIPESSNGWMNGRRDERDENIYTLEIVRTPGSKMRIINWNGRCVLRVTVFHKHALTPLQRYLPDL